jgi:hypothetical protein
MVVFENLYGENSRECAELVYDLVETYYMKGDISKAC